MPLRGFHYTIDPTLVSRFRDFHLRLQKAVGDTYPSEAAANALGVYNGDIANALNDVREKRSGKKTTSTSKTVENLINGLRMSKPAAKGYFAPSEKALQFWTRTKDERIGLAIGLEKQLEVALVKPSFRKPPKQVLEVLSSHSPADQFATGASSGIHWKYVAPSDLLPSGTNDKEIIRGFLRGRQRVPIWIAKHGSVWRGDVVERILSSFDDRNFLILHGPAGHGKSVSALQTLAAWVERGSTAIMAYSEAALHDETLELACITSPGAIILLDDVLITRPLPLWLNLQGEPTALVLQTIQTRKLDNQRMFLGSKAKRLRVATPKDATPFAENLILYSAAFTDDKEQVTDLFGQALSNGNFGGGLWEATWEATRGEKIDDRIGMIVTEIFDDPTRADDQICVAAATFLNGLNEFNQLHPFHSRLTLNSYKSTIAQLIENHLDLSDTTKRAAQESLNHIGGLLADELLSDGQDPHVLDLGVDPLIEFRSASVTHAFYRWIFGQFRGEGDFRVSRWPFYSALSRSLVQRRSSPADFVGALSSLNAAWQRRPQHLRDFDHGRSKADVSVLACEIYDASPHEAFYAKCRMDLQLARAMLVMSREDGVSESRGKELRANAEVRLIAATVDGAPGDVLINAAYLVLTHRLEMLATEDTLAFDQLIKRVLSSTSNISVKRQAQYLRFKWICLHYQSAPLHKKWTKLDNSCLCFLREDGRMLNILHGYLDIVGNSLNHSKKVAQEFYAGSDRSFGLQSMVSVFDFAISTLSKNAHFVNSLTAAVGKEGSYAHSSGHPSVAGLRRILRAAKFPSVPFREVFGDELTALRDNAIDQIGNDDYSGLPEWLSESGALLRRTSSSRA